VNERKKERKGEKGTNPDEFPARLLGRLLILLAILSLGFLLVG